MSLPPEDWDEHGVRGQSESAAFDDDVLGLRRVTEHDESLADDVLAPEAEAGMFRPRRRKRRNPLLKAIALLAAMAVVLTASVYAFGSLKDLIPSVSFGQDTPSDYEGAGTGEVTVEIPEGAGGGQIAEILLEQDVIGSAGAFTAALQADPRSSGIQPGTYLMASQMSSAAALGRLLDGNYREINGVTIREGLWVSETFALLAESSGLEVKDYEAVDPKTLDLPEAANGELEGFLFPSTYEFAPDATPAEQLTAMIALGKSTYADLGISDGNLREVLTKASIVQGEGMFADDMPKIARVMDNRIEGDSETNGKMQMDSTVHFIYQERGRAGTTEEQRANDSPYNTYVNAGLPPGPINNPGKQAIQAVLNPAEGNWLYFVTVNPSTGETKFADTFAEHQVNVAEFTQWCAENPGQC